MEREQFTFYSSYWNAIKQLPKKERENALEAIIEYALFETVSNSLSPVANAVFLLVKPTLDAGRKKAENRKTNREQNENKTEQNENKPKTNEEQNEIKTEQNVNEGEKEREGEGEREEEREIENECYKENTKRKIFSPPTVDEVRAYCRERKNTVNADAFVNFYASKGWKVGKDKMVDWKAAVRTWEQKEKPTGKNAPPTMAVSKQAIATNSATLVKLRGLTDD